MSGGDGGGGDEQTELCTYTDGKTPGIDEARDFAAQNDKRKMTAYYGTF